MVRHYDTNKRLGLDQAARSRAALSFAAPRPGLKSPSSAARLSPRNCLSGNHRTAPTSEKASTWTKKRYLPKSRSGFHRSTETGFAELFFMVRRREAMPAPIVTLMCWFLLRGRSHTAGNFNEFSELCTRCHWSGVAVLAQNLHPPKTTKRESTLFIRMHCGRVYAYDAFCRGFLAPGIVLACLSG